MTDLTEDILFKAGDVLFDTEKPLSTAYFILEGTVDLSVKLGKKTVNMQFGRNHFIGDAAVAVGPKADGEALSYHGRAVALEAVTVVAIPVADIKQELNNCSPLLKAWFASFINRVLTIVETLSHD